MDGVRTWTFRLIGHSPGSGRIQPVATASQGISVNLIVNGKSHAAEPHSTLEALVQDVSDRASGIAVARNGEVVPRSQWPTTTLSDGDRVDVVTAVQGG